MGCDIHLHLEYWGALGYFDPVIANFFAVGRDYRLFAALAGVRNYEDKPIRFPPRGIPSDASEWISEWYFIKILADDADDIDKRLSVNWCYESEARRYSSWDTANVKILGNQRFMPDPDNHTPSFLSLNEIVDALDFFDYDLSDSPPEFQMVVDFMRAIDDRFGVDASRIVFWFDN